MSGDLRLVIFDVDGTLVDSQADILAAMAAAYDHVGLAMPDRAAVLGIVGLSLAEAFATLAPEQPEALRTRMVGAYKEAYMDLRSRAGVAQSSPLYPGARETLEHLQAMPEVLLGIATGKSRRGLDKLIEGHGLEGLFVTQQVADFHPSKPHPSMILQAMADTGVAPAQTVMIGDTGFDMEMAAAAGVPGIGVTWGYHGRERLGAASLLAEDYDGLRAALGQMWSVTA